MTRVLATYVTVMDDHQHGCEESTLVFSPSTRAHFDPKFNAKKTHKIFHWSGKEVEIFQNNYFKVMGFIL